MKTIKKNSPKNKFRASINTELSLPGLGSSFTAMGMTIEEVKYNAIFYTEQAEKLKSGWYVTILENKKEYPNLDWQEVEKYQADNCHQRQSIGDVAASRC